MSVKIQINGLKELTNKLNNISKSINDVAASSLSNDMKDVIQESIVLCPKDTTALSQSTYQDEPEKSLAMVNIRAGYGGIGTKINPKTLQPTTTYMMKVHEGHERSPKFLERPFDRRKSIIVNNLVQRINKMLKG